MHSAATSRWVSEDRLVSLKVLGALIALLIILERAPVPLDPAILQFFFHNRDIHSIHRDFLNEHHPTLRQTLDDWIALGPDGDPSPFRSFFASYLSQEVNVLFTFLWHILTLYSRLHLSDIVTQKVMMLSLARCSIIPYSGLRVIAIQNGRLFSQAFS